MSREDLELNLKKAVAEIIVLADLQQMMETFGESQVGNIIKWGVGKTSDEGWVAFLEDSSTNITAFSRLEWEDQETALEYSHLLSDTLFEMAAEEGLQYERISIN
jgi:hypothetical protein